MNCFFKGCKKPTVVYCTCSDVTYMCSAHIEYHRAYSTKTTHNMFSHIKTVPKGIKPNLITFLMKKINVVNKIRTELNKFQEEFNSFIMNTLSSISSIKKNLKSILKEISFGADVSLPITANAKLTGGELNIKIMNLFIKESLKKLKLNQFFERIEELNEKIKLIFKDLVHTKNDKLCYFVNGTGFFVEYDIQKSVSKVKHIDDLEPQGRKAAICYVDFDRIFLYGGGKITECLNSAYFINTKIYKIENLFPGIPRHSTTPIIFNQKIYVFGGWTVLSALNDCSYYDMNTKRWFTQSNLPSPQSDVSTVKLGNKILLTGYRSFLQLYYPEKDHYEDIHSGINPKDSNILIKYADYVYLLAKNVYRACNNCLFHFEHLNKSVSFKMTSCRPVIKNNKAYFVDECYQIHVFSFEDFSLKIIDKVKIYKR